MGKRDKNSPKHNYNNNTAIFFKVARESLVSSHSSVMGGSRMECEACDECLRGPHPTP